VLLQQPFHNNRGSIATDWTTFIVATQDLGHSDALLAPGSSKPVTITWQNQATALPTQHVVDVKLVRVITTAEISTYCSGNSGANINLAPHMTALNILARKNATETGQNIRVGQDKFFHQGVVLALGSGLEARHGFFCSVLPARGGPVMNVQSVSTAFIQGQSVLD